MATVLNFEAHQVFDIPPIKIEAAEHRAQIKARPCCQGRNKAAFPEHVNQPVQYGTGWLTCVVTYLSQNQVLPYARLKEAMADLFLVHLSEGTVNKIPRLRWPTLTKAAFEWVNSCSGCMRPPPSTLPTTVGTSSADTKR